MRAPLESHVRISPLVFLMPQDPRSFSGGLSFCRPVNELENKLWARSLDLNRVYKLVKDQVSLVGEPAGGLPGE